MRPAWSATSDKDLPVKGETDLKHYQDLFSSSDVKLNFINFVLSCERKAYYSLEDGQLFPRCVFFLTLPGNKIPFLHSLVFSRVNTLALSSKPV